MFTLRCTKRLSTRFGKEIALSPSPPTTRLGDWYANLLIRRPRHLIFAISERTFLPVVVDAKPIGDLVSRLQIATESVVTAFGVSESAIAEEMRAMNVYAVGRTASKQVVGMMTDLTWGLDCHLDAGDSLHDAMLRLAETPCSPLGYDSPKKRTLALFG